MKGVVIAGTASGVGKTVATLAVLASLETAGYDAHPAKAGPDYIDPSHHAATTGTPSRTLDTWLEGTDGVRRNYYQGDGDICVVEGVMGLYDGEKSSTAMVAESLDLPIALVVDASAGMESVAASAVGFREYASHVGADIDVRGVIAQRAKGGRHERGIREALPDGLEYFGRVPPRDGLDIPDRHLGLRMGDESPVDDEALSEVASYIRADRLAAIAREPPRPDRPVERSATSKRVAIARDDAFRFIYPATMDRLAERADVVSFAPTSGDDLPDCDGVYLPGGYPELHAERLAKSQALSTLRTRAGDGLPVYGECGGMMVLGRSLTTVDGDTHDMAGVLPVSVRMHDRYRALDHVELEATREAVVASSGERLRGHEFHYSSVDPATDARFAFEVLRGRGIDGANEGVTEHRTVGTYGHVHPQSGAFDTFVESL